ncbi:hypothetical protein A6R79_11770 [Xanthomonas translucens pv. translucens]|nr:hypothetical protein ATB54_18955 [Xanthomonas translucens]OAX60022.1 hypothetical protein A6R79_11770 [Xanthomonas translucens pv. translucens]
MLTDTKLRNLEPKDKLYKVNDRDTLAEARERLGEAKRMIAAGQSPAKEKAQDKVRVKDAETFGAWAEKRLRGYQMADSTRDMRRSVYERELKPKFGNRKLAQK